MPKFEPKLERVDRHTYRLEPHHVAEALKDYLSEYRGQIFNKSTVVELQADGGAIVVTEYEITSPPKEQPHD